MMLDVGALGASTISACCLLGSPRPRRVWASASLMVLAMLGCVLASAAPGLGLVSIVLSLASAGFALQRREGRVDSMSLHRALGGVVMAAVVAMSLGMTGRGAATASTHAHGMSLAAVAFAFVGGYLAYSAWLLVAMARARRAAGLLAGAGRRSGAGTRGLLEVGEVAGMALGVLLMCVM